MGVQPAANNSVQGVSAAGGKLGCVLATADKGYATLDDVGPGWRGQLLTFVLINHN